jgi:23S rRNA pseudouridine2604 synthase
MTTLKLKKTGATQAARSTGQRAPLRGHAGKARPTLAQAQAQRSERAAREQEGHEGRERRQAAAPDPHAQQPRRAAGGPGGARGRALDREPRKTGEHGRAPAREPRRTAEHDRAPNREPRKTSAHGPATQHERRREPDHPGQRPREHRHAPPAHQVDTHHAQAPATHAPGSLRLSKRISELGLASRREADEWIVRGWVRVDGRVVSELGSRVLPTQQITIDAKARREQAQRVTVLVNKPVGFVSGQAEDGYEPALVLVTPERRWQGDDSGTRFQREHLRSLVPAGRLDIDSVGLLVLTQDGRIARQLIGEDSAIEKEYLVRVASRTGERLPDASLALLNHGLELDGEPLRPAEVAWLNDDQLRFVLHQGKKRQIRRMCEAVGLEVLGLKRVRIGRVMLGDLPPGQWRYLRADEHFG